MTQKEFIKYLVDILIYPDEFKINGFGDQYFYKDNKYYFQYNLNNDMLWCSSKYIWRVFKEEYGLNDQEIEDLLKDMLTKYFNMQSTKIIGV